MSLQKTQIQATWNSKIDDMIAYTEAIDPPPDPPPPPKDSTYGQGTIQYEAKKLQTLMSSIPSEYININSKLNWRQYVIDVLDQFKKVGDEFIEKSLS